MSSADIIDKQRHKKNKYGKIQYPRLKLSTDDRKQLTHKTKKRSSRIRTARLSSSGWGGVSAQPPLDADPPGHVTCDPCWEANPPPPDAGQPPSPPGQTNTCENISLRVVIIQFENTYQLRIC